MMTLHAESPTFDAETRFSGIDVSRRHRDFTRPKTKYSSIKDNFPLATAKSADIVLDAPKRRAKRFGAKMPSYIPETDAAFDAWSQNFSTLLTAAPTLYGLAASDATTVAAAVLAFHTQYLLAGVSGTPPKTPLSPSTRTPVTIAAKDSAKAAALPILRFYAINIRNNLGVSNTDKVNIGVTIVKTIPTPIPAPVTYPILGFIAAQPGNVQFSRRDSATPTVKAMPFGAINSQIYIAFSDPTATTPRVLPATPLESDYHSIQTKAPFAINFDGESAGFNARIWARWQTRTGLVGDWSAYIDFVVPLGG